MTAFRPPLENRIAAAQREGWTLRLRAAVAAIQSATEIGPAEGDGPEGGRARPRGEVPVPALSFPDFGGVVSQLAAVPTSVPKPSDPDEHWANEGRALNLQIADLQWRIGDWARSKPAGLTDDRAAALAGCSEGSVRFCRWLSGVFPASRRRSGLSHTHHAAVARLPAKVAEQLLDQAAEEGWNVARMRAEAHLAKAESDVERARAAAARERAAASSVWRADSGRAVRECRERLQRAAADIRIAEDIVADLAAHPDLEQVHGNAVNGVVERLRAVFDPVAGTLGAWATRANRFARLQRRGAPA